MSRNNNPAGIIIGLILFAYIGFIFLFPNMRFFPIFTIFPSFFIIIFIISIATIASNKRRTTPNSVYKIENQGNNRIRNPYRVQFPQEAVKTSRYQKVEEDDEESPIVRFCQFCGTKIERDAIFCHRCGSKLE
jgi:hypothetical protein